MSYTITPQIKTQNIKVVSSVEIYLMRFPQIKNNPFKFLLPSPPSNGSHSLIFPSMASTYSSVYQNVVFAVFGSLNYVS